MEVGGVKLASYVDWGALRHVISVVGLPAASVPCGFTDEGLPVGLQIIGNYHQEARMLNAAHKYQQATDWHTRLPEEFK